MPKLIKNLKPQILEEVKKLIDMNGYEKLSMRSIAQSVGIAVGTLYNYYPNKNELLLEVLEMSWDETFQKLEAIDLHGSTSIEEFMIILYDDIVNRKGLGQILFSSDVSPGALKNIKGIFSRLENDLTTILEIKDVSNPRRRAVAIIITLSQLHQRFPEEREENIRFLMTI